MVALVVVRFVVHGRGVVVGLDVLGAKVVRVSEPIVA
jgi:hypothetical protein